MAELTVKVEIPQQTELIEAGLALCSFELRRRWETGGALCKVCRRECPEGGTIEHGPGCQVGRMMDAIYAFDEANGLLASRLDGALVEKAEISSDILSPQNQPETGAEQA